MKYTIGIDRKKIKHYQLLAELPIDILSVGTALIISAYLTNKHTSIDLGEAVFFLIVTLVLSFLAVIARKYATDIVDMNKTAEFKKACGIITGLWAGVVIWLIVIYNL